MGGLNVSLEISKNTLLATQIKIQTASHNIANADKKTYARQQAVSVTNPPYQGREGWIGMGSSISTVIQARDMFIEKRLMSAISKDSQYDTLTSYLRRIESTASDDGETGISGALGEFWDSWEQLNKYPDNAAQKGLVIQSAEYLASTVKSTYTGIKDIASDAEQEIVNNASSASTLLSEIAGYNEEIMSAELGGQTANDLRDKRYEALTELAEIIPVSFTEKSNGTIDVTMQDSGTAITLVSGNQYGSIQYDTTAHALSYTDYQATSYNYGSLSGGKIEALMQVYTDYGTTHDLNFVLANPDDPSLTYLDRFNAFAASLITNANSTHNPAGTGTDVFDGSVISPTFEASDIAVSSTFAPDSTRALSMTDLQDQSISQLGDITLNSYLTDIQQRMGTDQAQAISKSDFQSALLTQLQQEQQSVSGVSVDEEMVDMMKFQQIYQAAAKVIQTTGAMLNTVIQMV